MVDPQVTIGFNTKSWSHDLDEGTSTTQETSIF